MGVGESDVASGRIASGEERLVGAGKGRQIWRAGETVRRPTGPWTPTVHALLRHLEAVGFAGAPRVLGVDERGREVLTFVAGQDGRQVKHDGPTLAAAAQLIRRFHDAVASFRPPSGSVWQSACPPEALGGPPIVCHNDLAPYNTIYAGPSNPTALIDWDLAGPAPALWDVAHAAWAFVPLYTDDDCARIGLPVEPRGPRLRRFCDGYGLQERDRFLDIVRDHLLSLDSSFARRSIPYLDAARRDWERHLL